MSTHFAMTEFNNIIIDVYLQHFFEKMRVMKNKMLL